MYKVYIITNQLNGKQYVGITRNTIEHRFDEHVKKSRCKNSNWKLHRAIRKYGVSNFKVELLEDNVDKSDICARECYYIDLYDTLHHGYNMTKGGAGISNYKFSEEQIRLRNLKIHTAERNAKISKALRGRSKSEQAKRSLSNAMLEYHKTHDNSFKGKKHTQETKSIISVKNTKHAVKMIDKITDEVIQIFDNAQKAADWIVEQQQRNTKSSTIRGNIARHCLGIADCQTAYGYKWRYD